MKYGIVVKNITDLRSKPDSRSERKSQLLYNEPAAIDGFRNNYCRVRQDDGYSGWVRETAIALVPFRQLNKFRQLLNYRVKVKIARVYRRNAGSPDTMQSLFYNTRLAVKGKSGTVRIVTDFSGRAFMIPAGNLEEISKTPHPEPSNIIMEAKKFLGVPYLWGGISPYGFDCSGFVRAIMDRFNIYLPRDSGDQLRIGAKIAIADVRKGDLLFFKGHVGISMGGTAFIHASLGEGGVAINSLDPQADNFRKDLLDTFLLARRVLP